MTIYCPLCKTQMVIKRGKCKYGTEVKINQCPECGGVWAQPEEFYRVNPEETAKLVEVNEEKFEKKIPPHEKLSCPKCSFTLEKIQDPFLPDDIDIEQCIKCGGIWLKAGTFLRFSQWRSKKIRTEENLKGLQELKTQIDEELKAKIRALLLIEHHRERLRGSRLGAIGKFLNKPVMKSFRVEWEEHEETWLGILVAIFIVLLTIILRFIEKILD